MEYENLAYKVLYHVLKHKLDNESINLIRLCISDYIFNKVSFHENGMFGKKETKENIGVSEVLKILLINMDKSDDEYAEVYDILKKFSDMLDSNLLASGDFYNGDFIV